MKHGADQPAPDHERGQPDRPGAARRGRDEAGPLPMGSCLTRSPAPDANYSSGDDYIVEFLGYRFSFGALDFEGRVVAAAVKLGVVETPELDEDETADLVALAAQGVIDEPAVAARPLPRAQLGARLARRRRVARLLAAQADLPRRLARPPGEARRARGRLGRGRGRVRLPASRRRRRPLLELAPVPSWHELQFKRP